MLDGERLQSRGLSSLGKRRNKGELIEGVKPVLSSQPERAWSPQQHRVPWKCFFFLTEKAARAAWEAQTAFLLFSRDAAPFPLQNLTVGLFMLSQLSLGKPAYGQRPGFPAPTHKCSPCKLGVPTAVMTLPMIGL